MEIIQPENLFNNRTAEWAVCRLYMHSYSQRIQKKLDSLVDYATLSDGQVIIMPLTDNNGVVHTAPVQAQQLKTIMEEGVSEDDVAVDGVITNGVAIIHGFSSLVDTMTGQVRLFSALASLEANSTVMQLRDYLNTQGSIASEWLNELISAVPLESIAAQSILQVFRSDVEATTPEFFTAADFSGSYTETNAFALGFMGIWDDITSFFSNLEFDIFKMKEFFLGLWDGLKNLFQWLVYESFPNLRNHYEVSASYNIESIDIPMCSGYVSLDQVRQHCITENQTPNYPQRVLLALLPCRDADGSGNQYTCTIRSQPITENDLQVWWASLVDSIKQSGSVIYPCQECFLCITLDDTTSEAPNLFVCAYRLAVTQQQLTMDNSFLSFSMSSDSLSFGDGYQVFGAPIAPASGSNEDIRQYFANITQCDNNADPESFTMYQRAPYLSLTQPVSHGIRYAQPMSLPAEPLPSQLMAEWDKCFPTGDDRSAFLAACTLSAMVAYRLTNGGLTNVEFIISGPEDVVSKGWADLANIYLPYEHVATVSTAVHAQTDSERADEAKSAMLKVLIAAAIAGVTVASVKLVKKLKKYKTQLALARDLAYTKAKYRPTAENIQAFTKLDRKARWVTSLLTVTKSTAETVSSRIIQSAFESGPTSSFSVSDPGFSDIKYLLSGSLNS